MISLDTSLATKPDGGALQRHIAYAGGVQHLTIVVYTPPGAGETQTPAPNLTIIPTNSISRFTFVTDALRIARRVIQQNRPDMITTQDPFSTGLVGWLLRGQAKAPLLVQNHCYFIDNTAWLAENPPKHHALNVLGKFISRRADVYRTVNDTERGTYLTAGGDPARVVTQPLGTASEAFIARPTEDILAQTRDRLGFTGKHKIIIWVGYPVPFKRIPVLLEVFKRVVTKEPCARLLLVGDMSRSRDDLSALISTHGLDKTVVTDGPVPHGALPAYYGIASLFAMTSAYEGVPRVLMEASAAGLPLVGFDRVGVTEVIHDGQNGFVVPEGDLNAFASRILELLHDPGFASKMGQAAREQAQERFSASRNVEGVIDMWHQTVRLGMRP